MQKLRTKVKGFGRNNDTLKNTETEQDSIQRINRRKAQQLGDIKSDSISEEEIEQKPSKIIGNDNIDNSVNNEPPLPQKPANPGEITLTELQLKQMLDMAALQAKNEAKNLINQYEQKLQEVNDSLTDIQRKTEEEKSELLKQVEYEKQQKDAVARIFNDFGYAVPSADNNVYIAPLSMRGGMDSKSAMREFKRLCSDHKVLNSRTGIVPDPGEEALHQDLTPIRKFINNNRDVLREGMEQLARDAGLLKGTSGYVGSDSPTTFTTLPFALQTYLSEIVRAEHTPQFVLWQFVNRAISTGIPPGQTVAVPRVLNLETGTSSSDWELTPGTAIVDNYQPLQGSSQQILIKDNGMGKNNTIRPVSIPDFVSANSLLNLESILQQRIGINYYQFEDLAIYEMLAATTVVVYNNNDNVAFLPASVTKGGQTSLGFLSDLAAYASSENIRSLPDGCYVFVCPRQFVAQLDKSLQSRHQYMSMTNTEELANMLAKSTNNNDLVRISGYRGTFGGLHIFSQSNFGSGIVGSRGVQTETLGTTSTTTRSGYLIGADAMGWATSMPMQIRQDPNTNYDRLRKFIWNSHEGWGPLDVDPNSNPPASAGQQLRVIEVRMSDVAIV